MQDVHAEMEKFIAEARKLGAYNVPHPEDHLGTWVMILDINRREHGFSRVYMCLLHLYVAAQMKLAREPAAKIKEYLSISWAVLPQWESKVAA